MPSKIYQKIVVKVDASSESMIKKANKRAALLLVNYDQLKTIIETRNVKMVYHYTLHLY